jgi:hypothetical protein
MGRNRAAKWGMVLPACSSSQPVTLRGQIKILLGEPTRVVGGKKKRHLVPADIDVGVMLGLLRELRDRIDELDGEREVLELVGPQDCAPFLRPLRQIGERGFDLWCGEFCHGAIVAKMAARGHVQKEYGVPALAGTTPRCLKG